MPDMENEVEEAAQHITGRRKSIKGATEAPSLLQTDQNDVAKTDAPAATAASQDERKKGKMWDTEEIMGYYEAVKQHGKDWDRLVTAMQKKKIHKDKDQIRNFFFNCVKFLRNLCDINVDEMFPEVCRDAKELFFVINSCEWRKRTGASKYQPERLKELILEGSTTIKANKKNMVIRTPFCPALQKYFTEYRIAQNDKPSEIMLFLQPATYLDKNYVLSCEQNPSLCLRISTNDRIGRIFELLGQKWVSKQGYMNSATITLLPDKTTEIGRVTLVGADPYGDTISLSKLKREQDSIKQKKDNESGETATNPIVPTYNAVINRPFTIDGQLIINGLTATNVGEASIAELYCLCGLSLNIKLLYKINAVQQPGTETWKVFRELITREYGDQLASSGKDDEKTKDTVPPKTAQNAENREQIVRRKRPAPQPVAEVPPTPIAHEQEALLRYKEQLKSCASRTVKIRGKKKEQERSPRKMARTVAYSSNVYSTAEFLDNGRCQIAEPTDFSQMVTTSSSSSKSATPSEPATKQRNSFKDIFDGDLDYSPRKMATNSLCSDSMQNIVHSTMKDVLHQDSNQAINVFSELLDDFDEENSHQ